MMEREWSRSSSVSGRPGGASGSATYSIRSKRFGGVGRRPAPFHAVVVPAISSAMTRQYRSCSTAAARCCSVSGVSSRAHRDGARRDQRTLVVFGGDVVDADRALPRAGRQHRAVRSQAVHAPAAETRQRRRMDVDDAAWVARDHLRGDALHEAGQHDQADTVRFEMAEHRVPAGVRLGVRHPGEVHRRNTVPARGGERAAAAVVAQHQGDPPRQPAVGDPFRQDAQIAAPARGEHRQVHVREGWHERRRKCGGRVSDRVTCRRHPRPRAADVAAGPESTLRAVDYGSCNRHGATLVRGSSVGS